MRKSLMLFGLAFLLAAGFLPCAHARVDDEKDEVAFRQEAMWGDPAAARGLTVEAVTHMDYRLFWTTDFWPGTEQPSKTEFEFSSQRRSEIYRESANLEVGFFSGNFGSSGLIDLEELKSDESLNRGYEGLWEPVIDVAGRTKSGEQRTETVSLAEYYQYYPMFVNGHLPWDDDSYYWLEPTWEAYDKLTRYFAVPVPDNAKLTVTVTKDEEGNVVDVTCNETEDYVLGNVWLEGVMTAEGGYFVMSRGRSGEEEEPNLIKSSPRLSSDYGIYFFPLKQYQDDPSLRTPDMAKLCNAFPVSGSALELRYDKDRDQLLLLTEEQGSLWLTVIDRKTMEQRQRAELGAIAGSEFVMGWSVQPQQMLVALKEQYDETGRLPSKRVVFLERDSDGWMVQMQSPITWPGQEEEQMFYDLENSMQMDYDGKRLALTQWRNDYDTCGVDVWICEDGALAYAGTYRRENTRGDVDSYGSSVRSWDSEGGLCASWDDKQ